MQAPGFCPEQQGGRFRPSPSLLNRCPLGGGASSDPSPGGPRKDQSCFQRSSSRRAAPWTWESLSGSPREPETQIQMGARPKQGPAAGNCEARLRTSLRRSLPRAIFAFLGHLTMTCCGGSLSPRGKGRGRGRAGRLG